MKADVFIRKINVSIQLSFLLSLIKNNVNAPMMAGSTRLMNQSEKDAATIPVLSEDNGDIKYKATEPRIDSSAIANVGTIAITRNIKKIRRYAVSKSISTPSR